MDFREIFTAAFNALRINIMRTLLTMLGIIVGITSVILIASIGQGAVAFITNELSTFGTNYFQITPGTNQFSAFAGTSDPITTDDYEALQESNIPNIENVAAFTVTTRNVSVGEESKSVTIYGVTSTAEVILLPDVLYGEFITAEYDNDDAKVAVLGVDVAEEFFGEDTDPVGESIRIDNDRYRVIGVTKAPGGFASGFLNNAVNIPLRTMSTQITGKDEIQEIDVSVVDTDLMNQTIEDVEFFLRDFRALDDDQESDFQIASFTDILDTVQTITGLLTTMMAGISGISLVVGGVGVMNIMLVSVTERTKEIGLLKAIGARNIDILTQFLVESVVMSLSGGIIGIILGISGAFIVSIFANIPFVISLPWIIIAVVISSLVGVVFGIYPARRAAKLTPIDALRHE
jgi:putative ABC transport system permease protein